MDVFYEESSIARNEQKGARKYKIFHIFSLVFFALGVFSLLLTLNIPIDLVIPWLIFCAWFLVVGIIFWRVKQRFNVSYDYSFVSGELRISKVINVNKRKLVAKIDSEDMLQIGDMDNPAFDRLKSDPMTKTVVCTSNNEAADGKFFMYILANYNGKKLFVLECREELLVHMLKFVKRSVLESDYVSQEKKRARA